MHPPLAQPACTLRVHCTVSQAWPGRVTGAPCRVAAPTRALARRVAGRVLRAVLCIVSWRRVPFHAPPAPYRGAPLRRIVAPPLVVSRLSRDTTQRPSRPPVTIQFIVSQHTPPIAKPSRAGRLPCAQAGLSWPVSAVSWAWLLRPAYCVTIQCTVS